MMMQMNSWKMLQNDPGYFRHIGFVQHVLTEFGDFVNVKFSGEQITPSEEGVRYQPQRLFLGPKEENFPIIRFWTVACPCAIIPPSSECRRTMLPDRGSREES